MSRFISWTTMSQARRVVVSTGSHTAVREVSEFVDVESVLTSGESVDRSLDLDFLACSLHHLDHTRDS